MTEVCQVEMCAYCFRAPLALLRYPVGGEPHVAAEFWIPKTCSICEWRTPWDLTSWACGKEPLSECHQVCLPTSLINMSETVLSLARCSIQRGKTVAQVEQQVVHLAKAFTKEPEYAFALRRCALWFILREQDCLTEAGDATRWERMNGKCRVDFHGCFCETKKKPVCCQRWQPIDSKKANSTATPPPAKPKRERPGPVHGDDDTEVIIVGEAEAYDAVPELEETGFGPNFGVPGVEAPVCPRPPAILVTTGSGSAEEVGAILDRLDAGAPPGGRAEGVWMPRDPKFVTDVLGVTRDAAGEPHALCSEHRELRPFGSLRTDGVGGWKCHPRQPCPHWKVACEATREEGEILPWEMPPEAVFPDLTGAPEVREWQETATAEDGAEPHFVADCPVDAEAQLAVDVDLFHMLTITVQPPPDMQGEMPCDGGEKVVVRRMPHLGPRPYAFSNNGDNLSSANHLRCNGQAGDVRDETVRELIRKAAEAFADVVIPSNKEKVVLPARVSEVLPKKYTCPERERYERDMWNMDKFSEGIKAHIKLETSAKPKPRPINAHGTERLAVNCPLLGTYEAILKQRLSMFTIKGKQKRDVMTRLSDSVERMAAGGLNGHRRKVYGCGFDQTAFEFGGNPSFKEAEDIVLRRVADLLGAEEFMEVPSDLLDWALKERLIEKDWIGNFKDKRGMMYKHVVKMYSTMRESGDRGTSSLNWLDNMIWVCVSLCRADQYHSFWKALISANGTGGVATFPSHDMGMITIVVNAEGDDIMLWTDRPESQARLTAMAHNVGWCSKAEPVEQEGPGYFTYVGFHVYTLDGVPRRVQGNYVMFPELRRFLTTKSWGLISGLNPEMRAIAEALNMEMFAIGFAQLPPMAAYCRALAVGWRRHVSTTKFPKYLQFMLRQIEMNTGIKLSDEAARHWALEGGSPAIISEEVQEVSLAMSSMVTGGKWGELSEDDTIGLLGMVEFNPLSSADCLKQYVPRVWWA